MAEGARSAYRLLAYFLAREWIVTGTPCNGVLVMR